MLGELVERSSNLWAFTINLVHEKVLLNNNLFLVFMVNFDVRNFVSLRNSLLVSFISCVRFCCHSELLGPKL
jgi:hypothetical protein